MTHTYLLIAALPTSPAPYWTYLKSPQKNFRRQLYKFLCLKLRGHWTKSRQISTRCTEMIADYSTSVYQSLNVGEDRPISFWDTGVRKSTIKKIKTRNAWQNLAYSPLGATVSPPYSKTKPCYHLANVQRVHIVSVCLHYGKIIWLPWQRPLTKWKIRYRSIIRT